MKAFELMVKIQSDLKKYTGKLYEADAAVTFDGRKVETFRITNFGNLVTDSSERVYITNITEVKEIRQTVDFWDAVKAYTEGKPIWVEVESQYGNVIKHSYNFNSVDCGTPSGFRFIDEGNHSITTKEILDGKWYIGELPE